jgi:uncharacterized Fe-S cluster protein YjdI
MDDDRQSHDAADAGAGGAGAPPEETTANRAPPDLTREYEGDGIRVQWFASRCIHSAACIRAQPEVFDARRRPWIDLRGADADAVADAVLRCPTGALHFTRTDGGPPEPEPSKVTVTPVRNGPYLVRGAIEIVDATGNLVRRDTRVALCRCGRTKHAPFCDNTHRETGFRMK